MNLQYISDSKGETTGVFIPINDWDELKNRFKGIEQEAADIPEWHKVQVNQRMEDFKKNPGSAIDFELAMNEIEKDL